MQALSTAVRCLWFVLICLFATGVSAQSTSQPLSSVLNPDGSISANITGSFDPTGYRMTSGPNGEPRFVSSQQPAGGGCTPDRWDTSFTANGANNDVNAIVSDGAGNIYFGGSFSTVQGFPIPGIAKWNGASWSGLGSGVNGAVNAIAINGTDIYVGGNFGSAGGNLARNVAKWDGTAWSPLGAGLGNSGHVVETIAIFGGAVYIGGNFNINDGSPANGLVRWDGAAYSGAGISGQVYALTVSGGNLYVGGILSVIADTTLGGLIKWDGVSWSGFGLTPSGTIVDAIGINGTDIYVGGRIRRPGSSDTHVAKWNGTAWTSLGFFQNFPVWHAFAFVGGVVYAGGTFQRFNGTLSDGIVKYNGSQWSEVSTGTQLGSAAVHAILVSGSTLYIGGDFQLAGGVAARNIATLTNGTTWAAPFPGTGLDGAANAIATSGTDVYLGGSFIGAGPVTANRIAKWDGANAWSALGVGISGFNTQNSSLAAIAVAGGKVYAGGRFSTIGGITANGIAVWNGVSWATLGTGITGGNGWVTEIIAQGDDIIVGGDFTTAGGVPAFRLAKWNGTSWAAFPGSPAIPSVVTGIGFVGNDMYVTATSTAVENPNYVLRYDGTNWTGIAPGMGGHGITSMAIVGSDVYVAGGFQAIAGVSAVRVAKWNGSNWSALGGGLPATTGSASVVLGSTGTDLIASGDFTVAAGGPAGFIARWNGSAWSTLGNGLNSPASRIVSAAGDIFIGGGFTTAGCNQSPYFARWRETVWTGSASADWHDAGNWGGGPVPPANAGMTISANNATISSADVSVSSLVVTAGRTLAIGAGRTLTVNGRIDLSNGFLTGPGNLVVNGNLILSNGGVSNLGAITINGNLYLNGGNITGPAPVSLTTCRATGLSGGSASSFIASPLTRCIGTTGTYLFPVATGTVYSPIELSNITGSGNFTVESKAGAYPGATGLPANRLQRWWDFTNTGITQANLVFTYSDAEVVGLEHRYRVYRINGGVATQLPTTLNQTSNRATVTGVTSFSPWTLAEGTSVPLTLSGRVTNLNANGRGVAHTLVSLNDGQGNIRYVITNHLGYYRFTNVPTFHQYTVRVTSKKYTFAAPERVVDFDEFTTGINFISSDN